MVLLVFFRRCNCTGAVLLKWHSKRNLISVLFCVVDPMEMSKGGLCARPGSGSSGVSPRWSAVHTNGVISLIQSEQENDVLYFYTNLPIKMTRAQNILDDTSELIRKSDRSCYHRMLSFDKILIRLADRGWGVEKIFILIPSWQGMRKSLYGTSVSSSTIPYNLPEEVELTIKKEDQVHNQRSRKPPKHHILSIFFNVPHASFHPVGVWGRNFKTVRWDSWSTTPKTSDNELQTLCAYDHLTTFYTHPYPQKGLRWKCEPWKTRFVISNFKSMNIILCFLRISCRRYEYTLPGYWRNRHGNAVLTISNLIVTLKTER